VLPLSNRSTYSDVHFVLLKWIHLNDLTSDIPCLEVDALGMTIRGNGFVFGQMSSCSFGLGVMLFYRGVCVVTGRLFCGRQINEADP
jgi:hypothetical protein